MIYILKQLARLKKYYPSFPFEKITVSKSRSQAYLSYFLSKTTNRSSGKEYICSAHVEDTWLAGISPPWISLLSKLSPSLRPPA